MRPVPFGILAAAVQTYNLEIGLGAEHDEAVKRAIESALTAWQLDVWDDAARKAIQMAEELDDSDDDDLATDGPAALLWLAREIQQTLPQD